MCNAICYADSDWRSKKHWPRPMSGSLFPLCKYASFRRIFAGIAQLVEQLICNQQVVGSNPTAGSSIIY
jgi:hypothetical protein